MNTLGAFRCFPLHPAHPLCFTFWRFYVLEVDKTPESVYRQAAVQFIIVELDLAFTYCQLALSSDNLGRTERNIINAKQALQTALNVEKRVAFPLRDKQIIDEKILHVESLLSELTRNRGSGVLAVP